jgi:hypothetical protein
MQTVRRTLLPFIKILVCAWLSLYAYLFFGAIVLFLNGCSAKPETVYIEKPEPYAVPTKCDLTLPKKTTPTGVVGQDVQNVEIDADIAREIARKCGAQDE